MNSNRPSIPRQVVYELRACERILEEHPHASYAKDVRDKIRWILRTHEPEPLTEPTDQTCPDCGAMLRLQKIGSQAYYYCPACEEEEQAGRKRR